MSKEDKPAKPVKLVPAIGGQAGTPTAAPESKAVADPDPSVPTHRISGLPERGFYRAGRHWPREGVEVARSEFSDEQWGALENEPRLTIDSL